MDKDVSFYVGQLALQPHPEGGYFREVYRSEETIDKAGLPDRFDNQRNISTSIYFLLTSDNFSALHRIKSDEMWHFYAGGPIHVHVIHLDGNYELIKLGNNIEQNEHFQAVVPAGAWFGATVPDKDNFALCGCTVAPGFDFADFEMGDREKLLREFPQHEDLIRSLTR